jgi:hypothetical protein
MSLRITGEKGCLSRFKKYLAPVMSRKSIKKNDGFGLLEGTFILLDKSDN